MSNSFLLPALAADADLLATLARYIRARVGMNEPTDINWTHASGVAALVRPGTGGTVVIVPGAMADAQGWLPVANALQTSLSTAIVNRRERAPSGDLPPDAT